MSKLLLNTLLLMSLFNNANANAMSEEKLCNELAKKELIEWNKLITNKKWFEDIPQIRKWNNAQTKARSSCSVDGHLYDGIIQLNKHVQEFGKAGGFKLKY
ncbi:hypothetical protein ALC152_01450 [Arcobacter sp. 15-2]|uniref:hypothetical protein n=1 Tax=Arcobacter sp. 15-2 TaxID=3374109 RepID=UPI00399D3E3F